MMLMVPLFEALGHDMVHAKAYAPRKLEIAKDALMTAARCARSSSAQDVLQAVAIALHCVKEMLEGLDPDTGDFTQWTEVSWRQFAPHTHVPCSSVRDHELFVQVAGSAHSAQLLLCLQTSREACKFMGLIAESFFPASDPVPIQQAFREARKILEQQEVQWKKITADVLCAGRAQPENDDDDSGRRLGWLRMLCDCWLFLMCVVSVVICAWLSCELVF